MSSRQTDYFFSQGSGNVRSNSSRASGGNLRRARGSALTESSQLDPDKSLSSLLFVDLEALQFVCNQTAAKHLQAVSHRGGRESSRLSISPNADGSFTERLEAQTFVLSVDSVPLSTGDQDHPTPRVRIGETAEAPFSRRKSVHTDPTGPVATTLKESEVIEYQLSFRHNRFRFPISKAHKVRFYLRHPRSDSSELLLAFGELSLHPLAGHLQSPCEVPMLDMTSHSVGQPKRIGTLMLSLAVDQFLSENGEAAAGQPAAEKLGGPSSALLRLPLSAAHSPHSLTQATSPSVVDASPSPAPLYNQAAHPAPSFDGSNNVVACSTTSKSRGRHHSARSKERPSEMSRRHAGVDACSTPRRMILSQNDIDISVDAGRFSRPAPTRSPHSDSTSTSGVSVEADARLRFGVVLERVYFADAESVARKRQSHTPPPFTLGEAYRWQIRYGNHIEETPPRKCIHPRELRFGDFSFEIRLPREPPAARNQPSNTLRFALWKGAVLVASVAVDLEKFRVSPNGVASKNYRIPFHYLPTGDVASLDIRVYIYDKNAYRRETQMASVRRERRNKTPLPTSCRRDRKDQECVSWHDEKRKEEEEEREKNDSYQRLAPKQQKWCPPSQKDALHATLYPPNDVLTGTSFSSYEKEERLPHPSSRGKEIKPSPHDPPPPAPYHQDENPKASSNPRTRSPDHFHHVVAPVRTPSSDKPTAGEAVRSCAAMEDPPPPGGSPLRQHRGLLVASPMAKLPPEGSRPNRAGPLSKSTQQNYISRARSPLLPRGAPPPSPGVRGLRSLLEEQPLDSAAYPQVTNPARISRTHHFLYGEVLKHCEDPPARAASQERLRPKSASPLRERSEVPFTDLPDQRTEGKAEHPVSERVVSPVLHHRVGSFTIRQRRPSLQAGSAPEVHSSPTHKKIGYSVGSTPLRQRPSHHYPSSTNPHATQLQK